MSANPPLATRSAQLEEDLDQTLFQKHGAMIRPTPAAIQYYDSIAPALRTIEKASIRLREKSREAIIMATYPGLAAHLGHATVKTRTKYG